MTPMRKRRKLSILSSLMLWLSGAILLVGVSMILSISAISAATVERDLESQATEACLEDARSLRLHVWNMDDGAIRDYFNTRAHARVGGYVSVRVLSEFGDVIFEKRFSNIRNVVSKRVPIYYVDNLVGYIEVELSRERAQALQGAVVRVGIMIIALGIGAILLVSTTVLRVIMQRPLRRTVSGVRRIAGGDYASRLEEGRSSEVEAINREINSMAARIAEREAQLEEEVRTRRQAEDGLRELTSRLEEQVAHRTQSLREAYERLKRETEERCTVQDEILSISSTEQQRIGRDLHDSLGQALAGILLMAAALEEELRNRARPEVEAATEIVSHLRNSVAQLRQIAYGLNPVDLAEGKLDLALNRLVAGIKDSFKVVCTLTRHGSGRVLSSTLGTHLYRITQEAIHNARVHGMARHIDIQLSQHGDSGVLIIEDDGVGISETNSSEGMGLRIMKFRAESIGGNMQLTPRADGGTVVRIKFNVAKH